MGNVIKLPKLLAWAPSTEELKVSLSAILVAPGQEITRNLYLMFLGERIQALVNGCDDPQDAADSMVQDLFEAGLLPDLGYVEASEAGAYLVSTNPGTRQRLNSWGVLPTWEAGPTMEIPAAREVLMGERYDPEDAIRGWIGILSRLP